MQVGGARHETAPCSAHHESLLNQEWLDDILERATLLADGRGNAVDAHRPAVEALDDSRQKLAVEGGESNWIDFQQFEPSVRNPLVDAAILLDLRVVANPAKQPVGNPRCTAGALRDA